MFENMAAFWLAAIVVFLVVEALVPGLVSIWLLSAHWGLLCRPCCMHPYGCR